MPSFLSSTPLLAFWVHDLSPFLFRFNENIGIRYYGLAYLAGFASGLWLLRRYHHAGRSPIDTDAAMDLILALVIGVLVGGRVGYFLLYQPGTFIHDPLALFRVWDGGMASHGGFVGVIGAMVWFARARNIPFLQVADLVVTTAPAGLLFGRIANFINGELWGKMSTVPWAVIFPHSGSPGMPVHLIPPRHPSQLYEAGLEGVLLLAYTQWRFWRSDVAKRNPGQLAGEFLIAYSIARAIGELFREPDASLILGLSRGTFYSIFLIAGGIATIVASRRKRSPQLG
ncbi:MAG TPA: prolipoprotein diacylglyceryl transferase [Candidatus Didemnitutus sp.]|nr:prolipoprotein diacylglyceryl transferase [Candidatus Didemnitutus sp.]